MAPRRRQDNTPRSNSTSDQNDAQASSAIRGVNSGGGGRVAYDIPSLPIPGNAGGIRANSVGGARIHASQRAASAPQMAQRQQASDAEGRRVGNRLGYRRASVACGNFPSSQPGRVLVYMGVRAPARVNTLSLTLINSMVPPSKDPLPSQFCRSARAVPELSGVGAGVRLRASGAPSRIRRRVARFQQWRILVDCQPHSGRRRLDEWRRTLLPAPASTHERSPELSVPHGPRSCSRWVRGCLNFFSCSS